MQVQIYSKIQSPGKKVAILIDPDRYGKEMAVFVAQSFEKQWIDFVLLGGSLVSVSRMREIITDIKTQCDIAVILFPGNLSQVCDGADAILYLTLLSGRNPEYLIGQHVQAAPLLHSMNIEVLSTGYILIESGHVTSVQYITQTLPVPAEKTDIAVATALAGQYLGCKNIYLEAGSGADQPVPCEMISAVKQKIHIPLWVGGGIRSTSDALSASQAGADVIVLGSVFEKDPDLTLMICKTVKNIQ